jgi:hypothetical protein
VNLPARFRTDLVSVTGRAENLSQRGMRFIGSCPLSASMPVNVEIDLPDAEIPLSVKGEIRWSEAGEVGIHFTDVPASARRRLANLILRVVAKVS